MNRGLTLQLPAQHRGGIWLTNFFCDWAA